MSLIQDEIKAYEDMQASLEADHRGEWILMRDRQIVGLFPSFETAAAEGLRRFGRTSYLVREIGAEPIRLLGDVWISDECLPRSTRHVGWRISASVSDKITIEEAPMVSNHTSEIPQGQPGTRLPSPPGQVREIPIPIQGAAWPALKAAFPLTEEAWAQMIAVLNAMKPGLVEAKPTDPEESSTLRRAIELSGKIGGS